MNFLAHLFLSSDTKESRIGSLLADFTRIGNNQLHSHYHHEIADAIIIHRKIDRFTDTHSDVSSAVHLLFDKYRHYSRIIVDVYFDHFLTVNWYNYTDIDFKTFVQSIYRSFHILPEGLPDNFYIFTKRLKTFEILEAYGSIDDLKDVFQRIEMRIKCKPGIHRACDDLQMYYNEFNSLFLSFFPQLMCYSELESKKNSI